MTTTRYLATITHSSLSRAPLIDAGNTLVNAKRAATRQFGGGFIDHEIIVLDRAEPCCPVVARRRIGNRRWDNAV
jgi:hypothetical protein